MKFTVSLISVLAASLPVFVSAGQNCKCQDGNGQYNDLTRRCCQDGPSINNCRGFQNFPGPNNQCSASGTNCIDSGAFVRCCQNLGVGGAHCWN